MSLTGISINNFRVFGLNGSPAEFDLKPITILTGPNSSGKSSLIKALLLLKESLYYSPFSNLDFSKGNHNLNSFGNTVNDKESPIEVKFSFKTPTRQYRLDYSFGNEGSFEGIPETSSRGNGFLKTVELFFNIESKERSIHICTKEKPFDRNFIHDRSIYIPFVVRITDFLSVSDFSLVDEYHRTLKRLVLKFGEHIELFVKFTEYHNFIFLNYKEYKVDLDPDEIARNEILGHRLNCLILNRKLNPNLGTSENDKYDTKLYSDSYGLEKLVNNMNDIFSDVFSELGSFLKSLSHLDAVRGIPQRVITKRENPVLSKSLLEYIDLKDELSNLREAKQVHDFVLKWLNEFGIALAVDDFEVESRGADFITVSLTSSKRGTRELVDVGYGMTPIIPIILSVATTGIRTKRTSEKSGFIIIEEPEKSSTPSTPI